MTQVMADEVIAYIRKQPGRASLVMLTLVTSETLTNLVHLAETRSWSTSTQRCRATRAAGDRPTMHERLGRGRYDPALMWRFIDALDALELVARGSKEAQVAVQLGYSRSALGSSISLLRQAASAERERSAIEAARRFSESFWG